MPISAQLGRKRLQAGGLSPAAPTRGPTLRPCVVKMESEMTERRRHRRRRSDQRAALWITGVVVLFALVGILWIVSTAYRGNRGPVELPPLKRPFIEPPPTTSPATPAPVTVPAPAPP